MSKTYKLVQIILVDEEVKIGRNNTTATLTKREHITVQSGLSWEEAQQARRDDNSYIVVPEATPHIHSVTAKPAKQKKMKIAKKRLRRGKKASQNI